jgi:hypothetical protein
MTNFRALIALLSAILILGALTFPVFAIEYNPGVVKGQYAKYGNFVGNGPGVESFNDYDWLKLEVADVSGKEVTLLSTGQFKNGAAIPGNGTTEVWNVETGTDNGVPSTQGPIIAANLTQGDPIPPPNTYMVNRTENRMYLGVSRSVNVVEATVSTPDYSTSLTYVYDRSSGMLLESNVETTQTQTATSSAYSYSITETNIFGSTPIWTIATIIAVIALIVVIAVAASLVLRKRTRALKKG